MKVHERLRYARERAGMTGVRASELSGIGHSTISEFEHGKRKPSVSQLQKLAEVYRRSIAFFLGEEPLSPEVVLWRDRPSERAQETETKFLQWCEQYHNLEVWCRESTSVSLPQAQGDAAKFDKPHAAMLAKQVRDQLQLGDRPGQTLLRVLEEVCGIKIFHDSFEPTGTAASCFSLTFGAAVLLNAGNVRWRRNFDLAHEMFHLLTWPIFRTASDATSLQASEHEERMANYFAGCLLMPDEVVRAAIEEHVKPDGARNISFEDLFDIARQFDVSTEALIWRLHFLFRGPAGKEQTLRDVERARQLSSVMENRWQTMEAPSRWPARYHALAVKALRHGEISIGRFAQYLEISRQEAMRYVEQESTDGEKIQITAA